MNVKNNQSRDCFGDCHMEKMKLCYEQRGEYT